MKGPYGLEVSDGCPRTASSGAAGFFCQMAPDAMKDFPMPSNPPALIPRDLLLFMEKQDARRVFVLCQGEVETAPSQFE